MKLTGKLINSLINSLSKNNLAMYLKKKEINWKMQSEAVLKGFLEKKVSE